MGFWVEGLVARCYKDHVDKKILDRIGMTLWSLETYSYIDNKTKSYWIQRGFLLLFIFLDYRAFWPYAIRPFQCCFAPRPFRRFCSMGYTTEFHQNFDAVCITKTSDQDLSQQLSRVFFLLSISLVASDGECPRTTFLQPASLVEESNKHQGAVLCCVQRAMYLGLVTKISRTWCLWRGITFSAQAPS